MYYISFSDSWIVFELQLLYQSQFHHSVRLRTHSVTIIAAAYSTPGALTFKISVYSPKHLKIYHRKTTHALVHLHPISASSASPPLPPSSGFNGDRWLVLVACSTVTVVLAIANRVLYKLALVPMKEFPFFLAQLTTFGYQAGIVTDEMLAFPKSRFIIIGFLEALGVVSGMYSGANLPGPAIPILSQWMKLVGDFVARGTCTKTLFFSISKKNLFAGLNVEALNYVAWASYKVTDDC